MKLKEYQGKAIFKKNGIRIQEGFPVNSVDEIQGKLVMVLRRSCSAVFRPGVSRC